MRYHWRPWRQLNTNKFPFPQTNSMSAYDAGIGEPESSQDTPLRNTTPISKPRRPAADTTPQYKRPRKLNQCLTAHFLAVDIRRLDTFIDRDYDTLCTVRHHRDNLQTAIQSNDEILPIVEDVKEKARRSKESLDHLGATTKAVGSQDPDHEMPDLEDDPDDSLVDQCTTLHAERADALHEAIKNNEKVEKLVVEFDKDVRRAQATIEGEIEQTRLDFKTRLDQQREEISYKYKQKKMSLNQKLQEKQTVIDQMTRETAEDLHLTKVALAEKSAELARAEKSGLEDRSLRLVQEEEHSKLSEQYQCLLKASQKALEERKTELKAEIKSGQARHAEAWEKEKLRSQNELNLAMNALNEQHRKETRAQLKDLEMELNSRKESELQAQRDSAHGQHILDRIQLKRVWRADLKKRLAAEWSGKLAEADAARLDLSSRLTAAVTAKESIARNLKIKTDLLALETSALANTELDLNNLRDQRSTDAQDVYVQRSAIIRKDRHINGLEDTQKKLESSIARLRSNINRNDTEIKAQASTIASQKENLRELEAANQGLFEEKSENRVAMTRLVAEMSRLRSDLDTGKEELSSQANLIMQRNTTLHDLETANTRLCQAQTKATNEIIDLKSRLSTLESDMRTRDEEMRASEANLIMKDERIEGLELANAGLLKVQKEAQMDKVSLQIAFESAYDRQKDLDTELETRGTRLSSANEEIEQLRRSLEQVKNDLSIEKAANKTTSLEESLTVANENIETLSSNLRDKMECLGKETSNNASLLNAIHHGRILPGVLAGETVSVQALKLVTERKALIIVEKPSMARTVWFESLDRCELEMKNWNWCLRLKKGSDGGPDGSVEVRIKHSDCPDLKEWLKGPDVVSANN